MHQRPAIAVISPNVLTGIGIKAILEKIIPVADVEVFGDFGAFEEADADRFFHYFVAASLFAAHASFFRARRSKTILLTDGQPKPVYADMHCIDVCRSEESLVHDILRMQQSVHRPEHTLSPASARKAELTDREAEVLGLMARGLINKQIAERLNIGLTTVISHRRNISEKLGIHSVAELAIYAVTAGYADAEDI